MNAIDYMIQTEEDGLRLYEILRQEATNLELKEIFTLLADSQKRHLDALESLKENLSKGDLDSMEVKGSKFITNGFRKILNKRDLVNMLKSDQDAFWHVVTTEDEIINALEGIASAVPQEKMRRVLERVVSDEKEHLSKIENIYEFIETPHSYLEWGEFSNLHPL